MKFHIINLNIRIGLVRDWSTDTCAVNQHESPLMSVVSLQTPATTAAAAPSEWRQWVEPHHMTPGKRWGPGVQTACLFEGQRVERGFFAPFAFFRNCKWPRAKLRSCVLGCFFEWFGHLGSRKSCEMVHWQFPAVQTIQIYGANGVQFD